MTDASPPANACRIVLLPEDQTVEAPRGTPYANVFRRAGMALLYPCGGEGRCGRCAVVFEQGAPRESPHDAEHLSAEARAAGRRLACRCAVEGDAVVRVPSETRLIEPVVLTTAAQTPVALAPMAMAYEVELEPCTVERPRGDWESLAAVLAMSRTPLPQPTPAFLRALPTALRAGNWRVTLVETDGFLTHAFPHRDDDARREVFGIALDLGTTTIAASLHRLRDGQQLAVAARLNQQVRFGEDVISRIHAVYGRPGTLHELQRTVAESIDDLVVRLCRRAKVEPESIAALVVSGNAVMNHLFLGVPPESIGLAPYAPVFHAAPGCWGRDVGIPALAHARVAVLPNIGGFVGGDTVAGLVASGLGANDDTVSLLIDIGTNCELVLVRGGAMWAASAPAGPALEGACIEFGMRAEPGAIHDVEWREGRAHVHTLDDKPARGLCGSGLVHAVAALLDANLIQPNGRFAPGVDERGVLLAAQADGAERDVWLTPRDVREFQLARAAIVATWKTLGEVAGIDESAIARVYLAGAFGNTIREDAARRLGFVPPGVDIVSLGNASLEGARQVLLSADARATAATIPARAHFVELAGREAFDETFAMELHLG